MDTFFEQIISVKMTFQKKLLCAVIIILAAAVIVAAVFGILVFFEFMFLFVLIIMGVCFLAYKLICNLRIEYEYIITNGDLDIDVIINKSRRKRIASVQCKDIEGIQKYGFDGNTKTAKTFICCNKHDEAYAITVREKNSGVIKLVIAPNEKIKMGITKFLPRILVKDAFI